MVLEKGGLRWESSYVTGLWERAKGVSRVGCAVFGCGCLALSRSIFIALRRHTCLELPFFYGRLVFGVQLFWELF